MSSKILMVLFQNEKKTKKFLQCFKFENRNQVILKKIKNGGIQNCCQKQQVSYIVKFCITHLQSFDVYQISPLTIKNKVKNVISKTDDEDAN